MVSRKEKIRKEISVYFDRIEELEDETAEAVLLIEESEDDEEEDYSGEFVIPTNFLPEDAEEGDYLTIKIFSEDDGKFLIKEIDDDAEEVTLQFEDGEIYVPANFLPEDAGEGDNLTIEIFRNEDKTNAALDEARQLLKELE